MYKKYIKRNGKTYGPYIYQSRRVNGKVISEYHGSGKPDYKKFIFPVFVFLFIVMLLFLSSNFFNLNGKITGEAISEQNPEAQKENAAERLGISLKEGELIPASSKVIFKTAGNETIEYSLQDLISEEPLSGNYYLTGKSLSGEGEGYGLIGTKTLFPKIYFTLISKQIQAEEPEESTEPTETKETEEETEEENASEVQNQSSQNQTGITETPEQTEEENSTQIPETNETSEQSAEIPVQEPLPEQSSSETNPESEETTQPSEQPKQSSKSNTESESSSETESIEETSAPMTGGVITNLFKKFFGLFLGLRVTGGAISEPIVTEISGEVSADAPFVYDIKERESVELLPGSVRTDSENMSDSILKISSQENKVLVETGYSESEEGFGQNYSGIKEKVLYLNLSGFDLSSDILSAKIFYNNEEIFDLTANKTEQPDLAAINESEEQHFNAGNLTAEEIKLLVETFGNSSVQTIKSELFKGRYIIGYRLGDYEIEYSYDSNLNNETLRLNMESDRIRWLRNIAHEISKEESISQEANQFILNYSFGGYSEENIPPGANQSAQINQSIQSNQSILNDSLEE